MENNKKKTDTYLIRLRQERLKLSGTFNDFGTKDSLDLINPTQEHENNMNVPIEYGKEQHIARKWDEREPIKSLDQITELETLGKDSFGTVTKVRVKKTFEILAMKKIQIQMEFKAMIASEIYIGKELKNYPEFFIRLTDGFPKDNIQYLFFTYASTNLEQAILSGEFMQTFEDFQKNLYSLLQGLRVLKVNKLVHGNIKSSNIMIMSDGVCKIADFGQARDEMSEQTDYGAAMNKAPELVDNPKKKSHESDIWALSITVLEVIMGKHVYSEFTNEKDLNHQILFEKVKLPKECSKLAQEFFQDTLAKEPHKRLSAEVLIEKYFPVKK